MGDGGSNHMKKYSLLIPVILVMAVGPVYAAHKTTITVSCIYDYDVAFKKIVPGFIRKHPNIDVKLIPNESGFDNRNYLYNAGPDVLILRGRPLTNDPLVNLKAFPFLAGRYRRSIVPYAWARALDDRTRLLAIPLNIIPYCSYWRKDIFREAGVDFDSIKTVKDLYIAAGKISKDSDGDGKIDRWFMPYSGQISYMILSSSPRPLVQKIGGRLVLDEKRIRTALNWSRKFHQSGYDIGEKALIASGYRFYQNGEVAYESWPPFLQSILETIIQPINGGRLLGRH